MKRKLLYPIPFIILLSSCQSYQTASFWIENNSDQKVEFQSSVISATTMTGPAIMARPFTAKPGEAINLGEAGFYEETNITDVFNCEVIDTVKVKNPKNIENWVKTTDDKGKTKYVLYLVSK